MRARALGAAIAVLALTPSAVAAVQVHPSPFLPATTAPGDRAFRVDADALAALHELERVTLRDVRLANGEPVDLALVRRPVAGPGAVRWVDGRPTSRPLGAALSVWDGTVVGDERSEVFLALSPAGSRGWVRTGGELHHLLALPDAAGGWRGGTGRWATEAELLALGERHALGCEAERWPGYAARVASLSLAPGTAAAETSATPLPLYEGRVALETDFQFFELFGDLDAAETYALSLFGAMSTRFRDQFGVVLTLPYLGLYTQNDDPWTVQDMGGDSAALLTELIAKWGGGQAPVAADAYELISGAIIFAGIASLDALCDPDAAFAVAGDLHGQTPFPIAVGPLNWDFEITSHELGHVFGSPHTHDFCPPLDQCSPILGPCQTQQVCTSQGTIMSYCYACPGGLNNITTFYHPAVVSVIRQSVEASCLPVFEGVLPKDLGFALPGSAGTPSLVVGYAGGLTFDVTGAPPSLPGSLILSVTPLFLPLLGGTLVPAPDIVLGLTTDAAGAYSLFAPVNGPFPLGLTLYGQVWIVDPPSPSFVSATNGVVFELILP